VNGQNRCRVMVRSRSWLASLCMSSRKAPIQYFPTGHTNCVRCFPLPAVRYPSGGTNCVAGHIPCRHAVSVSLDLSLVAECPFVHPNRSPLATELGDQSSKHSFPAGLCSVIFMRILNEGPTVRARSTRYWSMAYEVCGVVAI
jgi:hypothetical protein